MDLECNTCTERFDGAERVPQVLLCGHTACLQCLQRLPDSSCATCRRDRAAARDPPPAAAPTPPAAAPSPPAAAPTPPAAAPSPPAALLAARDPPPAEALPPRELDVNDMSHYGRNEKQQEKAAALRDAPGVTRLVNVWCHMDPAWSLRLLQRAAPTLERLTRGLRQV
ncbi:uncharacterized protein LOC113208138 [Frankliniella occidentalis]|uniref:Uncharacterized protein LOC113208138 n=1 Tax=Frankliniella occidentalis TaxID=133901 RepID=A0A6J1SN90_FRAOC|nr:uncharacterized protein LOC113208138 [Frankliniella occidentalis]XP_026280790.2 uncharacterized protein LOC113208138 [Frankliniella occidentalis]